MSNQNKEHSPDDELLQILEIGNDIVKYESKTADSCPLEAVIDAKKEIKKNKFNKLVYLRRRMGEL